MSSTTHTNTHTNANEVTRTSASLFSCCRGRKAAEQHIHPLIGEEVLIRWAAQRRRGRLHVSRRLSVSAGQRGWFEDTEGFVYFSLTVRKWTRWQIHKHQVHKSSWSSSLCLCQFEILHLKYKVMQGRLHAVKSSHAQKILTFCVFTFSVLPPRVNFTAVEASFSLACWLSCFCTM